MQGRFGGNTDRMIRLSAATLPGLCVVGLLCVSPVKADRSLAERANGYSGNTDFAATAGQQNSSDNQPLFHLDYRRKSAAEDCQVPVPPIGAISPFPVALRLGAMVSPRLKFDGGVDVTIPGLHLLPQMTTRIDADAIVSANFSGISTLVPVTFGQIYNLNLPVSSRVYLGGAIGPYFGDVTRFGGKIIVGAEFSRFGLEGNVHFAGTGNTLLTVQARIGL
jgi:hypothetical protein